MATTVEKPCTTLITKRKASTPLGSYDPDHNQKRMKVNDSTTVVDDSKKKKKKILKERNYGKDSRSTRGNPSSPLVKEEKMQQYKKNQCWLIVKRMIVGKDGWALKKCIDLRVLDCYEQIKEEFKITTMKTIGLEDIEVKLNKYLYSKPDEFADDMRLVFCRAFLYPPRSLIHRIAKRLSESFESHWKSLKEKWRIEEDTKRRRSKPK